MANYEIKEHSTEHSTITRSVRDAQLAPGSNTSFIPRLFTCELYDEPYVVFVFRILIQAYPPATIDMLTFSSQHRFIILDHDRCFFTQDEGGLDIFTDLYVEAFNRCNELFIEELGDNSVEITKKEVNAETKCEAEEILKIYELDQAKKN